MGIICDDDNQAEKLVLQTLGISGKIPPEIGNLHTLTHVHLDRYVSLTLPAFAEWTTIFQLNTYPSPFFLSNGLTGQIGPQWHRLERLTELTLSRNRLSGHLPRLLGKSTALHHIELSYNLFTGTLASAFDVEEANANTTANDASSGSSIRILALDHNLLSGDLPDSLKALTKLEELYLNNNRLRAHIYDHFSNGFDRLGILDMSNNRMQGHIPDYLLELPSIAILDVHSNNHSGQLNHGNSTALKYLDVSSNAIDNVVPRSIGKHPNLAYLDMSDNQIEGTLPSELSRLSKLEYLFVGKNPNLAPAPLPEWLNDLPFLSAVSFRETSRVGALPTWLWRMDQLTMLDLEANKFNSTIPHQLHKMSSLEYCFLARNELTG
jgi:Leucine-rich repeat (LRR) protein